MSPTDRRKPGRPKDEELAQRRREELLAAATEVFAARTYSSTDVQEIADRAGVAKGTVYRYFPSKEELFLAALNRGLAEVRSRVREVTETTEEPLERLEGAMTTFLGFFDEHPDLVELLIQERAEFRKRGTLSFFAHDDAKHESMERLFGDLHESGHTAVPVTDRISDTLGEFLYGTLIASRFSGLGRNLEDRGHEIFGLMAHGLLGYSPGAEK